MALSHRGNWEALLADGRVSQTYRALTTLVASSGRRSVRRRDGIRLAECQRDAGLLTAVEYAERYREYTHWRERANLFNTVLHQYLDMTADRVRQVRRDTVVESLRYALLTLAIAVDDHRQAHAGEESLADTALWARLRLLSWPTAGDTSYRLAEAVAAERGRRGAARRIKDGSIQLGGSQFSGETVDVADLLLEITDHAQPSCDRAQLVERWRQRTPDLLESTAAKTAARRQKGCYSTQRLRRSLTFLESLGMVARTADDARSEVTVLNRAGLLALRRQWDREHFALDNVEL
ncbi:hypothetical protein [Amycolatopsis sp. H20-H5]|uniref:hypothetical protein n=1 Tax=Amycolatopsis sp. H20-H5 TaxID=3046309 RepID=UPI002DB70DB8|nr:hypothetical protein [Amycolatopsis sp. H20-H5]MEC3974903.1 hypothetical protein [Amycolatopsis sp. H20-H5]